MANNELLKQRVKGVVKFSFFRDGSLWYKTEDGWEFPVAVGETINAQGGSPTFNAEEKGITMMRWIRKYMAQEEEWKKEKE